MEVSFKRGVLIAFAVSVISTGCGSAVQSSGSGLSSQPETVVEKNDNEQNAATADTEEKVEEQKAQDSESDVREEGENDIVADAAHAYAKFIEEDIQEDDKTFGSIALIHIDEDDVPELAVSYGTSHADGVSFFSYDGNNVKDLGAYGSLGFASYEYKKGILYGYYTGMGSTYDEVGILNNGSMVEDHIVVITDLQSADPSASGEGFRFSIADHDYEETEITQDEYEKIISPYLIENRDYRVIYNEYLLPLHGMENIEESLIKSLEMEDSYPMAKDITQDDPYYSTRITP